MKLTSTFRRRLRTMWQMEFPLNARTMLFCFFMGTILSLPMGLLLVVRWEVVTPPLWTAPIYSLSFLISVLALPFWSLFAMRDQPLLRRVGITTGIVSLAAIALGCLFPAL